MPGPRVSHKRPFAVHCRAAYMRPLHRSNILPCSNGTRPRNGQDRSLQSTRGPRSVGRGLDPSADAFPIPGIHGQPPAPPAGRRGRRPLQRPTSFPNIVHARAVCGMAYPPADVPRGTSAGLFCWKNPFFIPSVCAIIDASGPKAAKKRKNRGGTAWQKSSQ